MTPARAMTGLCALALSACTPTPQGRADLLPQMLVMQSDPGIAAFFASEARAAGVGAIELTDSAGMRQALGTDAIGLTRLGAAGGSRISYNIARPDGATPQNIAHEIAHARAGRSGCDNHGAVWGDAYVAIAQRFEPQFPGVLWAGLRPTEQAREEAALYPEEQCG